MDVHRRSKTRLHLVRSHTEVVRRKDTYSGEWTQVRDGLLSWRLLNWQTERPVPLYVVGDA
jgi:hypothetical protein